MDIAFNPADYPTYNIGDKVTIRQWDDMASEFGLNVFGDIKVPKACFTEPMRKYCGKTLTIVRKNHYLSPNSDCYYFGGSTMVFTSLMFEQSYPTVVSSTADYIFSSCFTLRLYPRVRICYRLPLLDRRRLLQTERLIARSR